MAGPRKSLGLRGSTHTEVFDLHASVSRFSMVRLPHAGCLPAERTIRGLRLPGFVYSSICPLHWAADQAGFSADTCCLLDHQVKLQSSDAGRTAQQRRIQSGVVRPCPVTRSGRFPVD